MTLALKCLDPRPMAHIRLVCVPHAGAGASVYRPWADLLPGWIEPYAVQLPGREDRLTEAAIRDWDTLTTGLAGLVPSLPHGRIVIYGHSLGALIGLSLAHEVSAQRRDQPHHLFCGAFPWPGTPLPRLDIEKMSDDDLLRQMERRFGDMGPGLDSDEIRALVLPVLRTDLHLLQSFSRTGARALTGPLTVLSGRDDPVSQEADYAKWQAETTGPFNHLDLAAGHLFHQTHADDVVNHLLAALQTTS